MVPKSCASGLGMGAARSSRVLVYGGSRLEIGKVVGDWPNVPPRDILGLRDGLAAGRMSFGPVALSGALIFVLRVLWRPQERGGYPLTILIGPGDAGWNELGWNAAWLSCELLGTDGRQWLSGLQDGSRTVEALVEAARLRRGSSVGRRGESLAPSDLSVVEALAGSSIDESEGPIVEVPSMLVLQDRALAFALALEKIPPPCRPGGGWLVDSPKSVASAYNARVLLIPATESHHPTGLESLSRLGQHATEAWEVASRTTSGRAAVAKLEAAPALKWEDRSGLRRGMIALSMISRRQVADNLTAVREAALGGSALSLVVIEAFVAYLNEEKGGAVGVAESRLILDMLDQCHSIDSSLRGRLAPQGIAQWLLANGYPLEREITPLEEIPSESLLCLIEEWPTPAEIPLVLVKLSSLGLSSKELLECGFNTWLRQSRSLGEWPVDQLPPVEARHLMQLVREEARSRALKRAPGWERDFVAFAAVPRRMLVAQDFQKDEAIRLVAAALRYLDENRFAEEGKVFLEDFSHSRAVRFIGFAQRERLAKIVGGLWSDLATVAQLAEDPDASVRTRVLSSWVGEPSELVQVDYQRLRETMGPEDSRKFEHAYKHAFGLGTPSRVAPTRVGSDDTPATGPSLATADGHPRLLSSLNRFFSLLTSRSWSR